MTDVLLSQTPDGGEVTWINGEPSLTDGLDNAVFLSLFGGEVRDSGSDGDKPLEWWGNKIETDPAARYRSETQALIAALPLIPANMQRIEDAATRDLAWMVPSLAQTVVVDTSMPALNTLQIDVTLSVDGQKYPYTFLRGKQ